MTAIHFPSPTPRRWSAATLTLALCLGSMLPSHQSAATEGSPQEVTFDETEASFVKIEVKSNWGADAVCLGTCHVNAVVRRYYLHVIISHLHRELQRLQHCFDLF